MDAYRAELYGIYCILLSIKYISEHHGIDDGEINIICNCKGALTRAIIYDDRPTTRHPNYDLLWSIFDLRDNIEIDVSWEHVKGHQDEALLDRELTRYKTLNCKADAGAKEYLEHIHSNRIKPITELYGLQWQLCSQDRYIYKDFSSKIYMNRHGNALKTHIQSKQGYSDT